MKKRTRIILTLLIFTLGILLGLATFAFLLSPAIKKATQSIAGTWSTAPKYEEHYNYNTQEWDPDWRDYRTVFTADGNIGHYGNRTCDNGTWKWIGINKIKAEFTECYYAPLGEPWYCNGTAPAYTCEYILDDGTLYRTREGTGSDLDPYDWPMKKRNEDTNLETWWDMFPKAAFFDERVEQNLLAAAPALMAGNDVTLEQPDFPYEIRTYASCDLTGDGKEELFVLVQSRTMYSRGYQERSMLYILGLREDGTYTILDQNGDLPADAVSMEADGQTMRYQCLLDGTYWDGPYLTLTFGFSEGSVVVEQQESVYNAHSNPYLLYENTDFKHGFFTAYTALDTLSRAQHFYASDEMRLENKVYEETFQGRGIPFAEFDIVALFAPGDYRIVPVKQLAYDVLAEEVRYMSTRWNSRYDGEERPPWISEAEGVDPEVLLDQAADHYGFSFEKIWLPWTKETKESMETLMRCPMPDYYYETDYDALFYAEGKVKRYRRSYDSRGQQFIWTLREVYGS